MANDSPNLSLNGLHNPSDMTNATPSPHCMKCTYEIIVIPLTKEHLLPDQSKSDYGHGSQYPTQ